VVQVEVEGRDNTEVSGATGIVPAPLTYCQQRCCHVIPSLYGGSLLQPQIQHLFVDHQTPSSARVLAPPAKMGTRGTWLRFRTHKIWPLSPGPGLTNEVRSTTSPDNGGECIHPKTTIQFQEYRLAQSKRSNTPELGKVFSNMSVHWRPGTRRLEMLMESTCI
jgi:hypothetical protein